MDFMYSSKMHIVCFFLCFSFALMARGSNIAMFMSIGGPSHVNIFTTVAKVLIEDGHNITFFNGLSSTKFKNFTSVQPKVFLNWTRKSYIETLFHERINDVFIPEINYHLFDNSIAICEAFLESEEWRHVIKSKTRFDLVIINPMFGECGLILGHYYKAPVIYLGTSGMYTWTTHTFANPSTIIYKPTVLLPTSQNVLHFSQRLYSSITNFVVRFIQVWYTYPRTEALFKKKYGSKVPSIVDMERKVSLLFLDTNIGVEPPVPYMPHVVEIAGIHSQPAKPLTKDYSEFVENSPGVILFALGSLVKSSDLPVTYKKALLQVFAQLPYNVIWTWDDDQMEGFSIPKNVMVTKWMPQNDLLGHNKTKLFITHGGKQSTIESLYHGVPVVVVPVFSDQDLHGFLAQERGYGVILDAKDLGSTEIVLNSITTVLNDKKYSENAKKYSSILTDQPMSPQERVSYWTGYVLRHKGSPLLINFPLRSMRWVEYYLVDVLVPVCIFIALVAFVIYISITSLVNKYVLS